MTRTRPPPSTPRPCGPGRAAGLALALALPLALTACGSDEGPVWPLSGDAEPQRLSSTFGPRLQAGKDFEYDFHRGIDIPADKGSDVYAIAPGKVTRAGHDSEYSDKLVQIEHCDEVGACFYSNSMHLSEACVEEGDEVEAGDLIGLSGEGESGFPHLHFEIREGESGQDNCVHPLSKLPGLGPVRPTVAIGTIDDENPSDVSVEVDISMSARHPTLIRVEITTRDRDTGQLLEERELDLVEWNRKWSRAKDPDLIDNPYVGDMRIKPMMFSEESDSYEIQVRFDELIGAGQAGDLAVTARAFDVYGGEGVASSP